jgi:hypothetical protein
MLICKLSLNSNGIFSVGFTELWALANYSTNSAICGLFLDVSVVVFFVFANILAPASIAAHYAAFPLFPVYLPSILPINLAMHPVVRIGFGTCCLFGACVCSNTTLVAALFTASLSGELL